MIEVREISDCPEDAVRFVIDSWVKSYLRHGSLGPYSPNVAGPALFQTCAEILQHPSTRCLVCLDVAEDDPEEMVFLGYVVGWPKSLVYVYVKEAYRQRGLGTALVLSCYGGKNQERPKKCAFRTKFVKYLPGGAKRYNYQPKDVQAKLYAEEKRRERMVEDAGELVEEPVSDNRPAATDSAAV